MKQTEIRAALLNVLHANYTMTPVAWPNEHYDPEWREFLRPTMPGNLPGRKVEWSHGGAGLQPTTIIIQIFTPEGGGSIRANEIADEVVRLYTNAALDDFLAVEPPYKSFEGIDNHGYYQINITVGATAPTECAV